MTEVTVIYRFSGRYPGRKDPRTRTKGIMRERRAQKRREAENRNAKTPDERRSGFRVSEIETGNPELAEGNNERLS